MSIFNLGEFERQGQIENDVTFEDQNEAIELLHQATTDVHRSVQIYTPDLEPDLYDNPTFIENLVKMARGNRHARIQVLTSDTSSAIKRGHGLLRLAQTLTSTIEVRIPSEEYQEDNLAFILVDHTRFIYRPDIKRFQGIYNPDCKVRATKLADIFSLAWEHANLDLEVRRLSI